MSDDLISREVAIDTAIDDSLIINAMDSVKDGDMHRTKRAIVRLLAGLPPAQPEISRIEQELHGKTPEEQYEFLYWLLLKFALTYTDSRLAVIEWLRGEKEDG